MSRRSVMNQRRAPFRRNTGGSGDGGGTDTPPVGGYTNDWREHPLFDPGPGKVVWGLHASAPSNRADIDTKAGLKGRISTVYGGDDLTLGSTQAAQGYLNKGVVPRIDWQYTRVFGRNGVSLTNANGTGKTLWRWIADGHVDEDGVLPNGKAYKGLKSRLNYVKNLDRGQNPTNRIMLTLLHEIDLTNEGGGLNGIRGGTAADFRALWRHHHELAAELGVTNIVWVLNFAFAANRAASDPNKWGDVLTNTGSDGLYPGHDYVDWIVFDPYNSWGNRDDRWRPFGNIVNKYQQMEWIKARFTRGGPPRSARADGGGTNVCKLFGIGETGCTEAGTATMDDGRVVTTPIVNGQVWMPEMAEWLASPENWDGDLLKHVTYFSTWYSIQDNTLDAAGTKGVGNKASGGKYGPTLQKWNSLPATFQHSVWARTPDD